MKTHLFIMNRKLDDLKEYYGREDDGLEPLLKKAKSPPLNIDQMDLHGKIEDSMPKNKSPSTNTNAATQNDHMKLATISNLPAQSSNKVCHNRKRRPRMQKDSLESNTLTTDSSTSCTPSSTNNSSRKKSDLSCVVCSGVAHGYNFDAISCESCKAFFRRNALFNTDRLKCRRDGCCDITLETRRRCKSCRLKKCFAVGMRKEWILTEEEKLNKKRRIEENRRLRMTNDETNVSEEKINPSIQLNSDLQSVILENNQLTTKPTIETRNSTSDSKNNDVINHVTRAFNAGFQLDPPTYGWSYHLAKKVTALCQILNTKNTTALRLISFYKGLPEFDALNDIDKVYLIKNNLPPVFIFLASLGYDPINDIYREGNPPHQTFVYGVDVREAHGENIYAHFTSIMRSLHSVAQTDQRIIQLILVIILFSKGMSGAVNFNEPSPSNYRQVFQAQNFYVEHLWLFMSKFYGPLKSTILLSTLVTKCLHIQTLLCDIQKDIYEKIDPYQVPPIIRSLMHVSH
ncbi:unnamed protein product [Adineta ricciae]|uniref:Nuclear receptor domain-containing protein n=2 Tax=Adineta ricciae TaxID=249248 RepID=A0A813MNI7_ADIRI|nr:unnamed protein product [Adineta ricciae]